MAERWGGTPECYKRSYKQPAGILFWKYCRATVKLLCRDRWLRCCLSALGSVKMIINTKVIGCKKEKKKDEHLCLPRCSSSVTMTMTQLTTTWFPVKKLVYGLRQETSCRLSTRTTSTGGRWSVKVASVHLFVKMDLEMKTTLCVFQWFVCVFENIDWTFSLSVCLCYTGSSCGGWKHRTDPKSDAGGEEESICKERCGADTCRQLRAEELKEKIEQWKHLGQWRHLVAWIQV